MDQPENQAPEATTEEPEITAAPETTATGVSVVTTEQGTYPINHRLRAEAMARDGIKSDADGLISNELIADTAARLAREDAATKVTTRMKREDLVKIAGAEVPPVPVTDEDTVATIVKNIEAARAAKEG